MKRGLKPGVRHLRLDDRHCRKDRPDKEGTKTVARRAARIPGRCRKDRPDEEGAKTRLGAAGTAALHRAHRPIPLAFCQTGPVGAG